MPGAEIALAHSTPWYVAAGVGILLLPVVFFTLWKFIAKSRIELNTADLSLQQHSIFKASVDDLSHRLDDARKDRASIEKQYYELLSNLSKLTDEVVTLRHKVADQDTQMRLQAEALLSQARELAATKVELSEAKVTIREMSDHIETMGGKLNGNGI